MFSKERGWWQTWNAQQDRQYTEKEEKKGMIFRGRFIIVFYLMVIL